ncbi:hypothetical protein F5879DRAFT_968426, partial [Lentinula edodes]
IGSILLHTALLLALYPSQIANGKSLIILFFCMGLIISAVLFKIAPHSTISFVFLVPCPTVFTVLLCYYPP